MNVWFHQRREMVAPYSLVFSAPCKLASELPLVSDIVYWSRKMLWCKRFSLSSQLQLPRTSKNFIRSHDMLRGLQHNKQHYHYYYFRAPPSGLARVTETTGIWQQGLTTDTKVTNEFLLETNLEVLCA